MVRVHNISTYVPGDYNINVTAVFSHINVQITEHRFMTVNSFVKW